MNIKANMTSAEQSLLFMAFTNGWHQATMQYAPHLKDKKVIEDKNRFKYAAAMKFLEAVATEASRPDATTQQEKTDGNE